MKKRLFSAMLSALMLLSLTACGPAAQPEPETPAEPPAQEESAPVQPQAPETPEVPEEPEVPAEPEVPEEPEEPAFDGLTAYGDVLAGAWKIVTDPMGEHEPDEGEASILEAARVMGDEASEKVGYLFEDLNGDGVDELLIGCFGTAEHAYVNNEIYAAYTHNGEMPVLLFEGFSRSAYSVMEDGTFFYYGSAGAMYSIVGRYELTAEGEMACLDYYFTDFKGEDMSELGVFYNSNGVWDTVGSEETDLTADDLWAMQDDLAAQTAVLEGVPFAGLEPAV